MTAAAGTEQTTVQDPGLATEPGLDIGWLSELLEMTDTGRWRDSSTDDQARFIAEMLSRRGETLDLEYRVTLSVSVAQWAARHDLVDAQAAARDFHERLCPQAIADGLNQLEEVQIDGVGFNVGAVATRGSMRPVADLEAAARALFEIQGRDRDERWEEIDEERRRGYMAQALRVVEQFQGATHTVVPRLSCRSCAASYDDCSRTRDDERDGPSRGRSCCYACHCATSSDLHEVRVPSGAERDSPAFPTT